MVELVFTACLLAGSHDCHQVKLPMEDGKVTINDCMDQAQKSVNDWQKKNPKYMVVGFQCKAS